MVETARKRPYRGVKNEDRRAQRRDQLMAAAVRLYGRSGYQRTTVKAICDESALTERYFYESFENHEALLIACFKAITHVLFNDIESAVRAAGDDPALRARAGLTVFYEYLKHEPDSARVFMVEFSGISTAVDSTRADTLTVFGRWLLSGVESPSSTHGPDLLAAGITGGVRAIALEWIKYDYSSSVSDVVEYAMQLWASGRPAQNQ